MAELVSLRGTCTRLKVGCVLVNEDNQVVASGYNGGQLEHCNHDNGHHMKDGRCSNAYHAEQWALSAVDHVAEGLTAYTTHSPCSMCYAELLKAGIAKVVYRERFYRVPEGMDQDPKVIHAPLRKYEYI